MEKNLEDISYGIVITQILAFLLYALIIYFLYRFFKKVNTYLNLSIKKLKKELDE